MSDIACESCRVVACEHLDKTAPDFCVQTSITKDMHDEALRLYNEPENHLIMESAAIVSAETVNSTRVLHGGVSCWHSNLHGHVEGNAYPDRASQEGRV